MNRWQCGQQSGRKRRLLCNGADTGCVSCRPHHRTRKRAHFPEALHARERGKSAHEAKQMTTAKNVGAVSSEAVEWYAIDWQAIHRNVRRLQVRIAQATKEGRWGKVRALQRLLTHSYSGKVLAVRRVTVLEGDIKSCFDRISHDWLLTHVPMDRVILQKWLKSGYMDKHVLPLFLASLFCWDLPNIQVRVFVTAFFTFSRTKRSPHSAEQLCSTKYPIDL